MIPKAPQSWMHLGEKKKRSSKMYTLKATQCSAK